jgi:hypothetical protein
MEQDQKGPVNHKIRLNQKILFKQKFRLNHQFPSITTTYKSTIFPQQPSSLNNHLPSTTITYKSTNLPQLCLENPKSPTTNHYLENIGPYNRINGRYIIVDTTGVAPRGFINPKNQKNPQRNRKIRKYN